MFRAKFNLALGLVLLMTAACGTPTPDSTRTALRVTATPTPTSTPTPVIPTATQIPEPTQDPDWTRIAPGIEGQTADITGQWESERSVAIMVRVDPSRARVTVYYDPTNPARVADWAQRLGGEASVVMNAGYYQQTHNSAGLVVSDGMRYGDTFGATEGYAEGMFAIAGGLPSIRALAARPYNPAEPLDQAVQGLPMLIDHGQPVEFDVPLDLVAPRTVIALDTEGRVLLIHVSANPVTLENLRDWLLDQPKLGIRMALNLDGGGSTGMVIGPPYPVRRNSVHRVPSVLAVSPR